MDSVGTRNACTTKVTANRIITVIASTVCTLDRKYRAGVSGGGGISWGRGEVIHPWVVSADGRAPVWRQFAPLFSWLPLQPGQRTPAGFAAGRRRELPR